MPNGNDKDKEEPWYMQVWYFLIIVFCIGIIPGIIIWKRHM